MDDEVLPFIAGTELYRERLVRALAHELRVPLLVLDSSVLAPYVRQYPPILEA